jgi:hypothetical protein
MKFAIVAITLAFASPAFAQHGQHGQHGQQHGTPYAGQQQRQIKALSEQQVADLRAGRGMSLALAGELNGYPGPLHVIELADRLQLGDDQRAGAQRLFDAMKAEASALGLTLIEQEATLDRAFAARRISEQSLQEMTGKIAITQGQLRAVHLRYHLATADLLTEAQRRQYAILRGYQ